MSNSPSKWRRLLRKSPLNVDLIQCASILWGSYLLSSLPAFGWIPVNSGDFFCCCCFSRFIIISRRVRMVWATLLLNEMELLSFLIFEPRSARPCPHLWGESSQYHVLEKYVLLQLCRVLETLFSHSPHTDSNFRLSYLCASDVVLSNILCLYLHFVIDSHHYMSF